MTERQDTPESEQGTQRGPDRRRRPTNPVSRYALIGRRRSFRRDEDRKRHIYVDRYGAGLFALLMILVILCTLDATLTIIHLPNQALQEFNPVMKFLLGYGGSWFFSIKYIVSALSIILLCIFNNVPLVRRVIILLIVLYSIILGNHLYLFLRSP